jgi:rhodanese-related sulfurtransferase
MATERQGGERLPIEAMLAQARSGLQRLEPIEAFEAVKRGAILIDTRAEDLRRSDGWIPGSLSVPLSVLEWRVDPDSPHRHPELGDLEAHVVLICAHGYSSSLAAARLQQLGFARAADVIGGFQAWHQAGLPVVRDTP